MKKQENADITWVEIMCQLMKGGVLAGVSTVILLLFGAVLISTGVLKERWMDGAVLAVCVIASMVGGLYSVKRLKKRTLFVGLGVGLILFLLLLAAGVLAYGTDSMGYNAAGILCSSLCGGGLAGIIGSSPKKKRRR